MGSEVRHYQWIFAKKPGNKMLPQVCVCVREKEINQ